MRDEQLLERWLKEIKAEGEAHTPHSLAQRLSEKMSEAGYCLYQP